MTPTWEAGSRCYPSAVESSLKPCSVCGEEGIVEARGDALCQSCLGVLGTVVRGLPPEQVSALWFTRSTPGATPADAARALAEFRQGVATTISQRDALSHFNLAVAYDAMGLSHDAMREAATALAGAPHDAARQAFDWLFVSERARAGTLKVLVASLRRRGNG
jgi:hypothetical protein